ncbi:hypothetical protein ACFQU7_43815 [Pseudoroseomonas wenyumeiae]
MLKPKRSAKFARGARGVVLNYSCSNDCKGRNVDARQRIFGSREVALPNEVAVYITEDDSGTLVGVVLPPGAKANPATPGDLPSSASTVQRSAELAINDGIRKSQALMAPLVIIDPLEFGTPIGELRPH